MKLLGLKCVNLQVTIYKSRNFMKLLGKVVFEVQVPIYKSRNFMKLLGTAVCRTCLSYLQE